MRRKKWDNPPDMTIDGVTPPEPAPIARGGKNGATLRWDAARRKFVP